MVILPECAQEKIWIGIDQKEKNKRRRKKKIGRECKSERKVRNDQKEKKKK